ncbi:uncharacterized protein [Nicotiana sylvestris]|uniref:uncharacterized protein n=1 Tax=Nicotiana sylvestris TaxID=4096 RepID=UPI00388C52A1
MLVYGTEAGIPTEVEIPSLRIIQEAELDDAEWVRSRYEKLALIDGKRMNSVCHVLLNAYFNNMTCLWTPCQDPKSNFEIMNQELDCNEDKFKEIKQRVATVKGKLASYWKDPFVVTRVLQKRALYRGNIKGNIPVTIVNANATKKYFV